MQLLKHEVQKQVKLVCAEVPALVAAGFACHAEIDPLMYCWTATVVSDHKSG